MLKARWSPVTLAIVGLVVLVGFGRDDSGRAADGADSDVATQELMSPDKDAPTVSASFQADAPLVTEWFGPLDSGTYRVDALGTPFSFTTDEPLVVQRNGMATFILTHLDSNGPDDRDIVVMRLSDLSDPTEVTRPPEDAESWWPVNDFSDWLDKLTDEIVISNRTTKRTLAAWTPSMPSSR